MMGLISKLFPLFEINKNSTVKTKSSSVENTKVIFEVKIGPHTV